MADASEYQISQAGGDGEPQHATFCAGDHVMGETPCTVAPAPRTEDFQLTELYGWYDGVKASDRIINCHECGAVVSYDSEMLEKHRTWHNKLLP